MPFKSNSTPACLTALSGLLLTTAATPKRSSFHQCSDVTRWTTRGQRKNKIFRRCWAHFEAEKLRIEGKVDSKIAHIRLGDFWIKLCWKDVVCGAFDNRGGIWWSVFPISKRLSNVTQVDVCKTYMCYWGYFLFHFTFTNALLITDIFYWRYLKSRTGILHFLNICCVIENDCS